MISDWGSIYRGEKEQPERGPTDQSSIFPKGRAVVVAASLTAPWCPDGER